MAEAILLNLSFFFKLEFQSWNKISIKHGWSYIIEFVNYFIFSDFLNFSKIFNFFECQSWNYTSIKHGWSYIISSHYTNQIARAYGLTFSRACFCRLCYLMSSSLCALPQYMCVLLHVVLETRDSCSWQSQFYFSCFSSRRSLSLLCKSFKKFNFFRLFFWLFIFLFFQIFWITQKHFIFSYFRVEIR